MTSGFRDRNSEAADRLLELHRDIVRDIHGRLELPDLLNRVLAGILTLDGVTSAWFWLPDSEGTRLRLGPGNGLDPVSTGRLNGAPLDLAAVGRCRVDDGAIDLPEDLWSGQAVSLREEGWTCPAAWLLVDGIRVLGAMGVAGREGPQLPWTSRLILSTVALELGNRLGKRQLGDLAHDFNNTLFALLGYCRLAMDDVPPDHPARPLLEEIHEAGERASRLVVRIHVPGRRPVADRSEADRTQEEPVSEGALVMVVDDERMIVDMMVRGLEKAGYSVQGFTDGLEALNVFNREPEAVDLVVTDQTMPGITGLELATSLLSSRPDLPIIMTTGYGDCVGNGEMSAVGVRVLLGKPLRINMLIKMVGELLDKRETKIEV